LASAALLEIKVRASLAAAGGVNTFGMAHLSANHTQELSCAAE